MNTPNFITLPSGRIFDISKLASVTAAKENLPAIRFSFGAQFNEMEGEDAAAVLEALDANGVDTKEIRKKAGLIKA